MGMRMGKAKMAKLAKESGKRKEATRSLERGDEQKALTRVAGRLPPCQPYISSSRYYSKYPHILLDGH